MVLGGCSITVAGCWNENIVVLPTTHVFLSVHFNSLGRISLFQHPWSFRKWDQNKISSQFDQKKKKKREHTFFSYKILEHFSKLWITTAYFFHQRKWWNIIFDFNKIFCKEKKSFCPVAKFIILNLKMFLGKWKYYWSKNFCPLAKFYFIIFLMNENKNFFGWNQS